MRLIYCLMSLTVLLGACGGEPSGEAPPLVSGVWGGEIQQYDDVVPFNFEVVREGDALQVFYVNGPERMPVEEIVYDGGADVEFNFPSYVGGLTGVIENGVMTGEVTLTRADKVHRMPFSARPGKTHRFFETPPETYADFSGVWATTISYPAFGFEQPAVGFLKQDGAKVTGTFETDVGDFRYLEGEADGDTLYLSAYDGGYTQYWSGTLQEDGTLAGVFSSVTYLGATWTARRDPEASLRDGAQITFLKDDAGRFDFSFPDLEGEPVSLSDPKYQGKVVLVVLAGSWCPSCHDEAAFMVPYFEANKDRGLEIVNLMFEYSGDWDEVKDRVLAFRDRYGITYDTLFAGASSRQTRGEALPQLNTIYAFPTTIFIDRAGDVRKIQTAFPGPATGQRHQEYKRNFTAFVDRLLAEEAPAATAPDAG